MGVLQQFAVGLVTICVIIMRGIGVIDDRFTDLMQFLNVWDPHWQLCILIGLIAFYVVLSLRAVGGMIGWGMLFFAVLLLLHRTVPALSGHAVPIVSQINNADTVP